MATVTLAPGVVDRARRSTALIFVLCGIGTASVLSRVPQLRDALKLNPATLGLLLLMIAVGAVLSLPLAGTVVHRIGAARTVSVMVVVASVGLLVVGIGSEVGAGMVGVGLFLFGFGNGQWDVAQNVEGAAVEQHLSRSIMSRFHAAFSLGTVAGALVGTAMNALHVAPVAHLTVVAVAVAILGQLGARGFLPAGDRTDRHDDEHRSPWRSWTEPRTLVIGVFVLCMAFAEGTGNDWLGVASIDGYGTSAALGSLAYVVFVSAMTAGRWFGPRVLDRHGRVHVLQAGAGCAMVGVLIVVFGPAFPTAIVGILLWGLGTALGFPTGMSAAADDPARAAARVSTVATIGYAAFLAGPSLIGLIGNHTSVLRALTLTAAVLALGAITATSTKPLTLSTPRGSRQEMVR
jgi:predicted MFS family arabinose efflux permease